MMRYATVTAPRWADAGRTAINAMVDFYGLGVVPFTASPTDLLHSKEIFARAASGEFGPVAEYVSPPAPEPPQKSEEQKLRAEIDVLKSVLVRKLVVTEDEIRPAAASAIAPLAAVSVRK